jgi:hypothetical protein
MADYKLIVREPTGAKAMEEITDFRWLSYLRKRNRPGMLQVGIPDDHEIFDVIGDRYQVEVWRRDVAAEIDWYRDFGGLFLLDQKKTRQALTQHTLYVPGYQVMLHWRRVMWLAGTNNRSAFAAVPAETVMKTLVSYNATLLATTAAGRQEFDGTITWPGTISVAVDQGRGNSVDWSCAWDWLDETLYDLAMIGGGDFDLVKTGANSWEFQFYPGQLGSDLSSTIVFSEDFDNLTQATYERHASQRVTGVLVGGPGQESARAVSSITATGWSQAYHVEDFVNAANFDTDAARQDAGRRRIAELAEREILTFDVQQTQGLRYGRDYDLGDKVTRRAFGITQTPVIDEVAVALNQNGQETIQMGFGMVV